MVKKKLKGPCRFDTDVVASNIWLSLLRDFRTSEGLSFCSKAEDAFAKGIESYRGYEYPELGSISVCRFKRYKQMQDLLKKYRFAVDAYSDEELRKITLQNYFGEQQRLALRGAPSALRLMVTQRARRIAGKILGSYDSEYVVTHSRFGSRSSIGCPLDSAYIDHKLTDRRAFTGSSQCSNWFNKKVLPGDLILSEIISEMGLKPSDAVILHESLNLVTVPKNWKTYRVITPLTLLSLFYSNGIGSLVTTRLRDSGLDITRLQNRHQSLVKRLSVTCSHATADLSAASDSLTCELLNQILPREWYRNIKPLLTHQVAYKTTEGVIEAYTESVLPMGNGLTFPVETLIFYSLIKAIGELAGIDGIFSVYGDDLIYPSKLHPYIVRIFPLMGLKLNLDKTFVKFPFRESCGSDFYRGSDVRSFYLQGESQKLTPSQYQAFLYKTFNGLVRRWDPMEIPSTLYYICLELLRVSTEIYRVPVSFPDTAGIKTSSPRDVPLNNPNLPLAPIWLSLDQFGNGVYRFGSLQATSKRRFVKAILPYYWLALQGLDDENRDYSRFNMYSVAHRQSVGWQKCVRFRKYISRGRTRLKRMVSYLPYVPSRNLEEHATRFGFTSEWI